MAHAVRGGQTVIGAKARSLFSSDDSMPASYCRGYAGSPDSNPGNPSSVTLVAAIRDPMSLPMLGGCVNPHVCESQGGLCGLVGEGCRKGRVVMQRRLCLTSEVLKR